MFSFFVISNNVYSADVACSTYKEQKDCNAKVGCSWFYSTDGKSGSCKDSCTDTVGITTIGINLLSDPTGRSCPNLTKGSDANVLAETLGSKVSIVVKVVLGFSATIGLIAFVYAGVIILASKGDPKSFQSGMNIIKYTFIGIIIIIFSYAIVNFLTTTIPSITGGVK